MELTNQAQESCFALVSAYLKQSFGELAEPLDEAPGFYVRLSRMGLYVQVNPSGEDGAYVHIYTWLGKGVSPTNPEVAARLLELNNEYLYGAVGVDSDGDIAYTYALPAQALDKSALSFLVRVMSTICEEIDDELRMRFS